MDGNVLQYLRCPNCAMELAEITGVLRCPRGHSFDIARQGYVNLAAGRVTHAGDTAQMVADRAAFLAAGHYDFISTALASAAPACDLVVDAGAGTGRHLAAVLDARPESVGLALDIAKPAVRRAARAHPRAAAALCDTWRRLPLADAAAGAVLDVFAPRNGAEFHRILRRDGALLVVTPTAQHLVELVGPLGLLNVDAEKRDRVAASLSPWFVPAGEQRLERSLRLTRAEVHALVGMGPSAWHTDPRALAARIATLPTPTAVTASVHLHRFTPAPRPSPFARDHELSSGETDILRR
jgi:23S rRNA (guanine745-N1)-methyltransferase